MRRPSKSAATLRRVHSLAAGPALTLFRVGGRLERNHRRCGRSRRQQQQQRKQGCRHARGTHPQVRTAAGSARAAWPWAPAPHGQCCGLRPGCTGAAACRGGARRRVGAATALSSEAPPRSLLAPLACTACAGALTGALGSGGGELGGCGVGWVAVPALGGRAGAATARWKRYKSEERALRAPCDGLDAVTPQQMAERGSSRGCIGPEGHCEPLRAQTSQQGLRLSLPARRRRTRPRSTASDRRQMPWLPVEMPRALRLD